MRYPRQMFTIVVMLMLLIGSCSRVSPASPPMKPAAEETEPFKIVVLPDTQNYTRNEANQELFAQQTQWIADNLETENIQFVTHVGDVIEYWAMIPHDDQLQIADSAMSILDGLVPYSVSFGNHDFELFNDSASGSKTMQRWFGDMRYKDHEWYGGASPDGENFYQTFSADGYDFLHINLKFEPDQVALDWAKGVIDTHPDRPTIVTTHSYLTDVLSGGYGRAGEAIWEGLVRSHDQIFMVVGGHYHVQKAPQVSGESGDSGEYHQTSLNDAGHEVYELLADYQDYPNGGDGWLQLIEFDIANDSINVTTYSPFLEAFQVDASSQFSFAVDFSARLSR